MKESENESKHLTENIVTKQNCLLENVFFLQIESRTLSGPTKKCIQCLWQQKPINKKKAIPMRVTTFYGSNIIFCERFIFLSSNKTMHTTSSFSAFFNKKKHKKFCPQNSSGDIILKHLKTPKNFFMWFFDMKPFSFLFAHFSWVSAVAFLYQKKKSNIRKIHLQSKSMTLT